MAIKNGFFRRIKEAVIGMSINFRDPSTFHKLSLVAFLAWIGLGSDGMSSSCYGPEETFLTLGQHHALGIFVALAAAVTIFIISSSYSQVIELFPSGGGGYLVASRLLSPAAGAVSGSALIIDYVLTISISIASGADALFSFLPETFQPYKFGFAFAGILLLTVMNLRGVKESIKVLMPIFMLFVISHAVILIYTLSLSTVRFGEVSASTFTGIKTSIGTLGLGGALLLMVKAYSMGAGTFTGIEAVSNGLPILAEPKVLNAKRTMNYMAWSLSLVVLGIMLSYIFFGVVPQAGKTLNAVLFESVLKNFNGAGFVFVMATLVSEALLLFVAAQTGFIDGPRVLANMARDRWLPTRFSHLSDRLVAQNGILLMSAAAILTLFISKGSVQFLVVLYSINVFITFTMSQLGMVVHWWQVRHSEKKWKTKIAINGVGLALTSMILVIMTIIKFMEGGWITMAITASLIVLCFHIKRHYNATGRQVMKLDSLIEAAAMNTPDMFDDTGAVRPIPSPDPSAKTAVIFVNGFNGLGIHTTLSVNRLMKDTFRNFIFVQIGLLDTGNFTGSEEMIRLQNSLNEDAGSYVSFMQKHGYYAESHTSMGTDIIEEALILAEQIKVKYPDSVFFGGQIVFREENLMNNLLHNYMVFKLQQAFYYRGVTFVIMPIRVDNN